MKKFPSANIFISGVLVACLFSTLFNRVLSAEETYDIVVYGGTSAAVTTAVQAKKMGKSVVIVSPDKHLGGLSSGGLGYTDSGNTGSIGGLAREFYRRVYKAYQDEKSWTWQKRSEYANKGQGTRAMLHEDETMWIFEPHIAERVFDEWVAELEIPVLRDVWLDRERGVATDGKRIVAITTLCGKTFRGKMFVDTTYEGDLLAAAGVEYHVGREANSQYGETWNGNQVGILHHGHWFKKPVDPYVVPGKPESGLLKYVDDGKPGVRGEADRRVQAYCYRMCLTDHEPNRVPFSKPPGYDPNDYELLLRVFQTGWRETFNKFDPVPNLKTDTNNHGPFSTDFIGMNYDYPEASYEKRKEIVEEHKRYQQGLMYFIANDLRIPDEVREKMSRWGLAADEFADNGHWPHQLYVREARRMVGEYVMTEHDCLNKRSCPKPIGMGSYTLDSHNVRRYVTPDGTVQNEGDIGVGTKGPYAIDYGSIIPKRGQCENLLVPVCVSSSHIAFGSIRMEPVFMILGQSAATAASLAIDRKNSVQDLDYATLRRSLETDGQRLEYARKDADKPAGTHFNVRKGISNSFDLFETDDVQQIVFFGGESLKPGNVKNARTYSNAIVDVFKDRFPDARISPKWFPDKKGSWYGAFRVARAEPVFGATVFNANLVFLDFVPEDMDKNEQEFVDAWEGMIRGILSFRPTLDVVLVYRLSPQLLAEYETGRTPYVIQWGEKLAGHYGLPSLNLAQVAADAILAGKIGKERFFIEGATTTPEGENIYFDAAREFAQACLKKRKSQTRLQAKQPPSPISETNMQKAQIVAYDRAQYGDDWKEGLASPLPRFRHVLFSDKPGAELSLRFTGASIGLMDIADPGSAAYEYSLDGSGWKTLPIEPGDTEGGMVRITKIVDRLDPKIHHELKLRLSPATAGKTARIGAFLVDGTVSDSLAGLSSLEKADAIYKRMDPIAYAPPGDRWKYIPKTMETMQKGGSLRIVLLGDSIMGDTSSSHFEKILERKYPNSKIEKILSNRSSTGCRWYKEDNRIEHYVLRHKPDLLIIGGISNGDVESMRSVVRQVREHQNPEIILMTPVFGSVGGGHMKNWTYEIDAEKYPFRAELRKMAAEERCEFIDLSGETVQYMLNSGKCFGWFMRDAVHANERGFQIIGRHLARYLTKD